MEQNENLSLFGLTIDPNSKIHLAEAARWGKFLAIVGFIFCGIIVVVGLFAGSLLSSMGSSYGGSMSNTGGLAAMMSVIYIIIALVYFFPCLFLYRFAARMKAALLTNEQETLNNSFQNLKAMLRYMGIIMIIVLVIWGLSLLTVLVSAASFS